MKTRRPRSQLNNKENALRILKSQLYELELRKQQEEQAKIEGEKKKIEWGSQIRSYVLHPYKMIKDLRTNHETGNVQAVLDGDLNAFIKSYLDGICREITIMPNCLNMIKFIKTVTIDYHLICIYNLQQLSIMVQKEKLFDQFPPVTTKEWMEKINTDLKGADFNKKLVWKTNEGFEVNPFYRMEDIDNLMYINTLPGEFPYHKRYKS